MSDEISLPKKRKITITVPESYKKVSDEVWKELETFLYMGFLTVPTVINEKPFVFKTVNQHELKLIEFSSPSSSLNNQFRARFIAYSIFMANGSNFLFDRPRHIDKLFKLILKLSDTVQNKIIENLTILNERSTHLYPLVEIYAYENRSRIKWAYSKSSPIHSSLNTGIPGTEQLGMNSCQQMWAALSQIIERRDEVEREWQHAKFIGSCFAGKGMRAIDERDRGRLEKERVDREELKMKVLFGYLNRYNTEAKEPENLITLPDGRKAYVVKKFKAETAEELAQEMSAVVSGEKDHHDRVMESETLRMQKRADIISKERNKLIYSSPRAEGIPEGGSRVIGGKAEAEALLQRIRDNRESQRQLIAKLDMNSAEEQTSNDQSE
jgi:hypothetical protein